MGYCCVFLGVEVGCLGVDVFGVGEVDCVVYVVVGICFDGGGGFWDDWIVDD